jgi:Fe-S cluster assembly ATP-binding protein
MQLELLKMDPTFLNRNVNQGFSGGEKKRNEILQLACLEVRGHRAPGLGQGN